MAIRQYLAMTAAEFPENPEISVPVCWLSALFRPYGTGLSNLPKALPPGALLVLSDLTPMMGHDPDRITFQLRQTLEALDCRGLILDFQRPWEKALADLAAQLVQALPCPVAVSDIYGQELDCPVFLPPVPPDKPLDAYLAPWQGREIWLEISTAGECITLTEQGAQVTPLPHPGNWEGFSEERLHCHYRIETAADKAIFSLWRTKQDLEDLLKEAEELGVTTAVGLWQELREDFGSS